LASSLQQRRRSKKSLEKSQEEQMADLLWENLEQAEIIRIPVSLMFTMIVGYAVLGAVLLAPIEQWSFLEGYYFSFISVFAIGDY